MATSIKKSKVKLDPITDIDTYLLVERITNIWRIMIKVKNHRNESIGM